jgi:hypothetical protein
MGCGSKRLTQSFNWGRNILAEKLPLPSRDESIDQKEQAKSLGL